MDKESVYSLSVLPPLRDGPEESRTQIQAKLRDFILSFQLDNAFIYRYELRVANHSFCQEAKNYDRDQIRENALVKQYYCDVDIAHIISFDEELAQRLTSEPSEIIPLVIYRDGFTNQHY